jgi:glycosyltransferase involved in cell wall biosynthesis
MLTFSVRLLGEAPRLQLPRPDAIIGSSVHPFAVWSSNHLAKRLKVPFLFEVRDLWPQTLIDFGLIKNQSLMAMLLRALEGYLYRQASAIIAVLPFAYRYIERFGVTSNRVFWIPNGVDLETWPMSESSEGSSSPLCLMYFGAFGRANALDILLLAMHELHRQDACPAVHLRLIGNGPLKANLIDKASCLGIVNVSFEDPVPKSEIPRLAAEANVFLANTIDSPLYRYGISLNKLYDYMAAGRPIIFGCSAANNPVAFAGAGITVPPSNPAAFAEAIREIANLAPAYRRRMGLAGRAYVEREHTSDKLGQKLAQVLNGCIEVGRSLG